MARNFGGYFFLPHPVDVAVYVASTQAACIALLLLYFVLILDRYKYTPIYRVLRNSTLLATVNQT